MGDSGGSPKCILAKLTAVRFCWSVIWVRRTARSLKCRPSFESLRPLLVPELENKRSTASQLKLTHCCSLIRNARSASDVNETPSAACREHNPSYSCPNL